jgi:hypothetical protein
MGPGLVAFLACPVLKLCLQGCCVELPLGAFPRGEAGGGIYSIQGYFTEGTAVARR